MSNQTKPNCPTCGGEGYHIYEAMWPERCRTCRGDYYNVAVAQAFVPECANCRRVDCVCQHPDYDQSEREWRRDVLGEETPP